MLAAVMNAAASPSTTAKSASTPLTSMLLVSAVNVVI